MAYKGHRINRPRRMKGALMYYQHLLIFLQNDKLADQTGTRVAYHKVLTDGNEHYQYELDKLNELDVMIYVHVLSTKELTTESIVQEDKYYRDIIYYHDFEEFLQVATEPYPLVPLDIARYFLLIAPMTLKKLNLLLNIAYHRYQFEEDEALFYYEYPITGLSTQFISLEDLPSRTIHHDNEQFSIPDDYMAPIMYRILFSEKKMNKPLFFQKIKQHYKEMSIDEILHDDFIEVKHFQLNNTPGTLTENSV